MNIWAIAYLIILKFLNSRQIGSCLIINTLRGAENHSSKFYFTSNQFSKKSSRIEKLIRESLFNDSILEKSSTIQ